MTTDEERLTPRQKAIAELTALAGMRDIESVHSAADAVLCELLRILGYDDVVDAYEKLERWYA